MDDKPNSLDEQAITPDASEPSKDEAASISASESEKTAANAQADDMPDSASTDTQKTQDKPAQHEIHPMPRRMDYSRIVCAIVLCIAIVFGASIGLTTNGKLSEMLGGRSVYALSAKGNTVDLAPEAYVQPTFVPTPSPTPVVKLTPKPVTSVALVVNGAVIASVESEQIANDALAKLVDSLKPSKDDCKLVSAEIIGEIEVLGQLEEASGVSTLGETVEKLVAAVGDGLFKLKTTETYTQTTEIDFKTETKEDGTMLKGKTTVLQAGVTGESETTYQLVFENGKQVSKTVLSEKVTKKAVNKIVVKGTKVETPSKPSSDAPSCGNLNFAWPIDGWVSSKFGNRDGAMHYGLDIAAVTGTPIYAAEAGTVTYSAEMGTYGLLVIIDHGNGFTTRYAHCSKLLVSVGDTVKESTKIALCGNTGNSRGAHLHFEVRYNGTAYDPLEYLP